MGINMELNDLKIFALYYIKESEGVSDKEKAELMEYVDSADESEILFLLATGCRAGNVLEIIERDGAYRFQEFIGAASSAARSAQQVRLMVKGVRMATKAGKLAKTVKDYDPVKETEGEKPWGQSTTFLATTALHALADAAILKIKKGYLDKHGKKCDKEKGDAKRACYNKIRKDAIRAQIVALNSIKVKCRQTNNEKECLKKADAKIKTLQNKMQTIKV